MITVIAASLDLHRQLFGNVKYDLGWTAFQVKYRAWDFKSLPVHIEIVSLCFVCIRRVYSKAPHTVFIFLWTGREFPTIVLANNLLCVVYKLECQRQRFLFKSPTYKQKQWVARKTVNGEANGETLAVAHEYISLEGPGQCNLCWVEHINFPRKGTAELLGTTRFVYRSRTTILKNGCFQSRSIIAYTVLFKISRASSLLSNVTIWRGCQALKMLPSSLNNATPGVKSSPVGVW